MEKSIRQRTRVIRVDGKLSTINLKQRLDRSPTRRGRIVKPATEGTEIPYEVRPSQSTINTHTTTTKTYPNHIHESSVVLTCSIFMHTWTCTLAQNFTVFLINNFVCAFLLSLPWTKIRTKFFANTKLTVTLCCSLKHWKNLYKSKSEHIFN